MNLKQALELLKSDRAIAENIVNWHTTPPSPGIKCPFPDSIDSRLQDVLQGKGIKELYSHQIESFELASQNNDFVVVTPTASGKSLC